MSLLPVREARQETDPLALPYAIPPPQIPTPIARSGRQNQRLRLSAGAPLTLTSTLTGRRPPRFSSSSRPPRSTSHASTTDAIASPPCAAAPFSQVSVANFLPGVRIGAVRPATKRPATADRGGSTLRRGKRPARRTRSIVSLTIRGRSASRYA